MGANQLPEQRQQEPFAHKVPNPYDRKSSPLPAPVTEGQQARGAQFSMQTQKMSPGLGMFARTWEAQQNNAFNQMGMASRLGALEQAQQRLQQQSAALRGPQQYGGGPQMALPQGAPPAPPPQPARPQGMPGAPAQTPQGPQYGGGPQAAYQLVKPIRETAEDRPAEDAGMATPYGAPGQGPGVTPADDSASAAGVKFYNEQTGQWESEDPSAVSAEEGVDPSVAAWKGWKSKVTPDEKAVAESEMFRQSLPQDMPEHMKMLLGDMYGTTQEIKRQYEEGGAFDAARVSEMKEQISQQQQQLLSMASASGLGVGSASAGLAQGQLNALKAMSKQKMELGMLQAGAQERAAGLLADMYSKLGNWEMYNKSLEIQGKATKQASLLKLFEVASAFGQGMEPAVFENTLAEMLKAGGWDENDPMVQKLKQDYLVDQAAAFPVTSEEKSMFENIYNLLLSKSAGKAAEAYGGLSQPQKEKLNKWLLQEKKVELNWENLLS